MEITVKIDGVERTIECMRGTVQPAEPDVGIMSAYVEDWIGRHWCEERDLTMDEYDLIEESAHDRILDLLTEEYHDEVARDMENYYDNLARMED